MNFETPRVTWSLTADRMVKSVQAFIFGFTNKDTSHQPDPGRGKQKGGSEFIDSLQELQSIQFFLRQRPILGMTANQSLAEWK